MEYKLLPWSQNLVLGIKVIDEQHHHFINILNKTYAIANALQPEEELRQIVKELEDYAVLHFDTEEKYFDEFHYPLAEEHKEQHRELLLKAKAFNERYAKEGSGIVSEFIAFLEDWLINHLEVYDKKYVECFHEHGLT